MEYNIQHRGSNALLVVKLDAGEEVRAEAGAMVAKSHTLTISGNVGMGGWGKALKRSVLGGENLFMQTVKAEHGAGEVLLAPSVLGDVVILDMTNGQDFFVQGGAFLASLGDIMIDTRMQKISQGLFGGEGLFVLHATGKGHIAVSSFGAIHEVEIPAGQDYIIDNGHLVAWSGDTSYKIEKAGKTWMSSFTSGEGLACRFTGPGRVWLQTRNPQAFGTWVKRFVPAARGGGIIGIIMDSI